MAALQAILKAAAVALVATTAKTVAMLTAPTNQCLKILGYLISFDGNVSTNTPVLVEYGRPSTAGTFTSQTPTKMDTGRAETVQATGGINASAEPTMTAEESEYIGAFNGNKQVFVPFQTPRIVPGGARWGIRATAPNNCNCSASIQYEE